MGTVSPKCAMPLKGHVEVWKNGDLVASGDNIVLASGKEVFAGILAGSEDYPDTMKMGSSGVASDESMTGLQGSMLQSVALSPSTTSGNVLNLKGEFTISGLSEDEVVREIGIFSVAEFAISRFLPVPFTIGNGDTLTILWMLTIG